MLGCGSVFNCGVACGTNISDPTWYRGTSRLNIKLESIESTCAIKRINGQLRGGGCENVGLWGYVETGALRRRSFGDCTRPTVAPSMDIDEAAVDKRFQISREGAMRWDSGGGYNTSIDIETPQIGEVVRE